MAGTKINVLLVDDEPMVRRVFCRWLERSGMVVHEAPSASVAYGLLDRLAGQIDVVLTDHAMPGVTGGELIQWVKLRWPALPIIMVSAYAEITEGARPDQLLEKPVTGSQLESAITTLLAKARETSRITALSRAG